MVVVVAVVVVVMLLLLLWWWWWWLLWSLLLWLLQQQQLLLLSLLVSTVWKHGGSVLARLQPFDPDLLAPLPPAMTISDATNPIGPPHPRLPDLLQRPTPALCSCNAVEVDQTSWSGNKCMGGPAALAGERTPRGQRAAVGQMVRHSTLTGFC